MLKAIIAIADFFALEKSTKSAILIEKEEYCLISNSGELILVFYGSNSLADWLDNFAYFNTNVDNFPKGWHSQATAAFIDLQGYKISYVGGYSRGAAIALIYAYYFDLQAICFSSPKVSKTLKYWKYAPILIGSQNDPVRLVPLFYKYPGCFLSIRVEKGGHLWAKDKFQSEIKLALVNYYL